VCQKSRLDPQFSFNHRKTLLPRQSPLFAEEIYDEKSDRQTLWKAFLTKNQIKHAPEKLNATARAIERFLIRLLKVIGEGNQFNHHWKTPGPWK